MNGPTSAGSYFTLVRHLVGIFASEPNILIAVEVGLKGRIDCKRSSTRLFATGFIDCLQRLITAISRASRIGMLLVGLF